MVENPALSRTISYHEITGLPRSSVTGHVGRFVLSGLGNTRVLFAQGRAHLSEGFGAPEITAGLRFLARAGIRRLILTTAVASLHPEFSPGSWLMLTDHLSLPGPSPLAGEDGFVDLIGA